MIAMATVVCQMGSRVCQRVACTHITQGDAEVRAAAARSNVNVQAESGRQHIMQHHVLNVIESGDA
jgi:hypothetical protein